MFRFTARACARESARKFESSQFGLDSNFHTILRAALLGGTSSGLIDGVASDIFQHKYSLAFAYQGYTNKVQMATTCLIGEIVVGAFRVRIRVHK